MRPNLLPLLVALLAAAGCGRPSRPPEVRAADQFMDEMKSGYTSTASLYSLPAVFETVGRARQRNTAWWGEWTPGPSRKVELGGSLEAFEIPGDLAGTDGVKRTCLVTVVKTDTWRVARVFIAGQLALPAPLDPADAKKPVILLCDVQHKYLHDKGANEWAPQIQVLFAGQVQGESAPAAFRVTAFVLEHDGAQVGDKHEVVVKASDVHDLTLVDLAPKWRLPEGGAKASPIYRLHLAVRNEATGETGSLETDIK